MEKSSRRGKIPQSDWPLIMALAAPGEALAGIARTRDCSAPAISYVVSRSRERQPSAPTAMSFAAEPQLIKASPAETAAGTPPPAEAIADVPSAPPLPADGPSRADETPARPNGRAVGAGDDHEATKPSETN